MIVFHSFLFIDIVDPTYFTKIYHLRNINNFACLITFFTWQHTRRLLKRPWGINEVDYEVGALIKLWKKMNVFRHY